MSNVAPENHQPVNPRITGCPSGQAHQQTDFLLPIPGPPKWPGERFLVLFRTTPQELFSDDFEQFSRARRVVGVSRDSRDQTDEPAANDRPGTKCKRGARKGTVPFLAPLAGMSGSAGVACQLTSHWVVVTYSSPGRSTVLGKLSWFGASGKPCGSSATPALRTYGTPEVPAAVPSRCSPV